MTLDVVHTQVKESHTPHHSPKALILIILLCLSSYKTETQATAWVSVL